jgi:hypothetical protein
VIHPVRVHDMPNRGAPEGGRHRYSDIRIDVCAKNSGVTVATPSAFTCWIHLRRPCGIGFDYGRSLVHARPRSHATSMKSFFGVSSIVPWAGVPHRTSSPWTSSPPHTTTEMACRSVRDHRVPPRSHEPICYRARTATEPAIELKSGWNSWNENSAA